MLETHYNDTISLKALDACYDNLPLHAFFMDMDGVNIWANKSLREYFPSVANKDFVGNTVFDYMPEKNAQKLSNIENGILGIDRNDDYLSLFPNSNNGKAVHTNTETVLLSTGKTTYTQSTKKTLKNLNGKPLGLLGFYIDITNNTNKMNLTLMRLQQDGLSLQQARCSILSMQGYSSSAIAEILAISKRTSEDYLNIAKHKLHCNNKQQLISKLISTYYY